jgi:hypothetical protein
VLYHDGFGNSNSLAPESFTIACSARSPYSEFPNSEGLLDSGLPNPDGFLHSRVPDYDPLEDSASRSRQEIELIVRTGEQSSGSSAMMRAAFGGSIIGLALCAYAAAFAVARRRFCAGDQTARSPAEAEVESLLQPEAAE